MVFQDALTTIVNSTRYDAMKRPAMGGYVFRSAIGTGDNDGDYTLTFVKRGAASPASSGSPAYDAYQLQYDANAEGVKWSMVSGKDVPELANGTTGVAEFWEELMADDWMVGAKADFERARVPAASDEW